MTQTQNSDTPATDHAVEQPPERPVRDILHTILAVVRDVSDPDRNLKMEKYCVELEAAVDKLDPPKEAGGSAPQRHTDADEASQSQTHSRTSQQPQSPQTAKR